MAGREQLGPYTLTWPDGVFPLGQDTLALGGFATVRPGWQVCDLGTGSGALLLLLARRQGKLSLRGVDLDPLAARTARENLEQNGLEGTIVQGDLRNAPLPAGGFDLVVSNPRPADPERGPLCPVPPAGAAGGPVCRPAGGRSGAETNSASSAQSLPSPLLCSGREHPTGQAGAGVYFLRNLRYKHNHLRIG